MKSFNITSLMLLCWLLVGCGGTSDVDGSPFASVDALLQDALRSNNIDGMGLTVYDKNGKKQFEGIYGDFSADRRVNIASASKMVSGVTLLALVDQGYLSLDSTTGEVLGWNQNSDITLRHLLSFTSGLRPVHLCLISLNMTLSECVARISTTLAKTDPGELFDYGGTHLHVVGGMAEEVTGMAWNSIFKKFLLTPLNLPSDLLYYANPGNLGNPDNPLLSGGLLMSMNEYAPILQLIFNKGVWQGESLIDSSLFDEQAKAPFPNAEIGITPSPDRDVRYGLAAWLECDTPETGCDKISSPGALGFTPWVDRKHDYYAILGMEFTLLGNAGFGIELEQQLQPLIEKALEETRASYDSEIEALMAPTVMVTR